MHMHENMLHIKRMNGSQTRGLHSAESCFYSHAKFILTPFALKHGKTKCFPVVISTYRPAVLFLPLSCRNLASLILIKMKIFSKHDCTCPVTSLAPATGSTGLGLKASENGTRVSGSVPIGWVTQCGNYNFPR